MNEEQWYYDSNGEQAGPVTWEYLKAGLRIGKVGEDTLVWAAHLPEWTTLSECLQAQSPATLPSPPRVLPMRPEERRWSTRHWIGGSIASLVLLGAVIGLARGLVEKRRVKDTSLTEGSTSQLSIQDPMSENREMKIKHEQEILKFAREFNIYTERINVALRASNARQIQSYIQNDVAARAQSLQNFQDSIQRYELAYGRQALLIFARENGLQNAIGL